MLRCCGITGNRLRIYILGNATGETNNLTA